MLNGIYKILAPSGIYICVSYGCPANRENFFKKPQWIWKLSTEKIAKLTISTTAGVAKEEGADQKNFHYIYILKKEAPIEEVSKAPEPKKEDEEGKSEDESDKDEME